MPRPDTVATAKQMKDKYGKPASHLLKTTCLKCKFAEVAKRDAKGNIVEGSWDKAIVRLDGGNPPTVRQQQNVNDWVSHVRCFVLPKGTELLHVTSNSDWIRRSIPGTNAQDNYGFFTSAVYGWAGVHNSSVKARIKLRLKQDVHGFFCPDYDQLVQWERKRMDASTIERMARPDEVQKIRALQQGGGGAEGELPGVPAGDGTETVIRWKASFAKDGKIQVARRRIGVERSSPNLGGAVVSYIMSTWPEGFRPALIVGCSECEFFFHSRVISRVMQVVGAATGDYSSSKQKAEDTQAHRVSAAVGQKIVPTDQWATASDPGLAPGLDTPPQWMGPKHLDGRRQKNVVRALSVLSPTDPALDRLFGG